MCWVEFHSPPQSIRSLKMPLFTRDNGFSVPPLTFQIFIFCSALLTLVEGQWIPEEDGSVLLNGSAMKESGEETVAEEEERGQGPEIRGRVEENSEKGTRTDAESESEEREEGGKNMGGIRRAPEQNITNASHPMGPPLPSSRRNPVPNWWISNNGIRKEQQVRAFAASNYQPPAQRPEMPPRMPSHQPVDPVHHHLPAPPQLSFRSPSGQYLPLWPSSPSSSSFAVPSPSGIAYYAPNQQQNKGPKGAEQQQQSASKPGSVLLIGAFPPSTIARQYRPQTNPIGPFITRNSPSELNKEMVVPPDGTTNGRPGISSALSTTSAQSGPTEDWSKAQIGARNQQQQSLCGDSPKETTISPKMTFPPTGYKEQEGFPVPSSIPRPDYTIPPPIGHFIPGPPFRWSIPPTSPTPSTLYGDAFSTPNYYYSTEAPSVRIEDPCTEGPPQPTQPPRETVPNRAIGRARIICQEEGIEFGVRTVFPFTGQIFAYDKKRIPNCVHTLHDQRNINISFSFAECGVRNQPVAATSNRSNAVEHFHLQIVVMFEQRNGTSSVQSYLAQCGQNRVRHEQKTAAWHIEEALEELHFIPSELEQKAPVPVPMMRVLKDGERDDGSRDVDQLQMGQPFRVEISLVPTSDAYGFLVRNCVIRDMKSGVEHEVIDQRGCSTDLNIFGHPHYDTFHDIARVHGHAFKLPDHSALSLKCRVVICTDLADNTNNRPSSCALLPSPPFCPDLVTSPTDSVLADVPSSPLFHRRRSDDFYHSKRKMKKRTIGGGTKWMGEQRVHTALCLGNNSSDDKFCGSEDFRRRNKLDLEEGERRRHSQVADPANSICVPVPLAVSMSTFFGALLLTAAVGNLLCRYFRRCTVMGETTQ